MSLIPYGDFGILRIQGEYEWAKLYKAALAKLMSVLRGHGCCSCLCCCCVPEEGTCFLDLNFLLSEKIGSRKKWHNRGMWIILKWAQFQSWHSLIRIPHHVEPVNACKCRIQEARRCKGVLYQRLIRILPSKVEMRSNLAWSHHSGRIACFGPGLTLLVASLRPQLADLSCDAAGSGILACSKSWLFTAFVAETCGSYCNLQKVGYDCKTIIKDGPQAMFSNG